MSDGVWGWRLIIAATVLVYGFMFIPIFVVVILSFNSSQFGGFPFRGFSFHWFEVLAGNRVILRALATSALIGVVTAGIATLLGVLAGLALVRYDFRGKEWINTLLIAPILIPETVLAVGLLLFLHRMDQPRTLSLMLMGHVVLALPYVVLVVQARLIGIKRVYEEAAQSLGANRYQTFREITLPLLMPAILSGALLAFTISFDNVTATLFWRPPGLETLPTQIYSMLRDSVSPEINALGTLMILITVGVPMIGGIMIRYYATTTIASKNGKE